MKPFSLRIGGEIRRFNTPLVMGILNVTSDSFYTGSHTLAASALETERNLHLRVEKMISEGVDIIDIGGCSTRPGSCPPSPEEELQRVLAGAKICREISPSILLSVDTYRADVARKAVEEEGVNIVNDISAGKIDPAMIPTVASLGVPYIMMHMRGTPSDMSHHTEYPLGIVANVASELHSSVLRATQAGIADIIIDPGFGFAKTVEQNYRLMNGLEMLQRLLDNRPLLVGISRKSMIYKPLELTPEDTLPGTDALNTLALLKGAAILRVHDVAAARQIVGVYSLLNNAL